MKLRFAQNKKESGDWRRIIQDTDSQGSVVKFIITVSHSCNKEEEETRNVIARG